jgi:hypothetical protein
MSTQDESKPIHHKKVRIHIDGELFLPFLVSRAHLMVVLYIAALDHLQCFTHIIFLQYRPLVHFSAPMSRYFAVAPDSPFFRVAPIAVVLC